MDAHIVESRHTAYATPRFLQVHEARPLFVAADNVRVVRYSRDARQDLEGGVTELDRLLAGLAVHKPKHPAPDIDLGPAQRADFAKAGAGKDQQPDGCNDPWGRHHV